ncbi:thiamine-monophosphate kinase [Microbacteriaceae bacterium SG_E_30_P1]|uniref:Thiamine-monophosphate kinase n=1 Tax=Antiquaquibacter oligotrophicus TaxID=2880260 RepID=A0ABT6KNW8_9MICO|nr:thiamine-phosphate kinase [Antiquaquibacter oligotrophicus]MDH6181481.1 thiamine-monophosphate kinase [Antiquaquibacter oligotrophicus]UDF12829.1 thiamine-phosphate kinase [Antiquaquibacter oligotrophicus]
MTTLGALGESAVLARIFPRLPQADAQLVGPGDDAAVIAAPDGRYVVTTDMMIHGPDFRLAWSSPRDLGWKAAASNLADVAAMGAVPSALVVALAAPADTSIDFLEAFADGLRDGCAELSPGAGVVGGDLSVSDVLTIAVTAFGDLEGRQPVLRSGAHPGDVVGLAGVPGLAAEGLRLLFEHGVSDGVPDASAAARVAAEHPVPVAAQLRPRPPISSGRDAAMAGATAMLDTSDGLAIDAARIASASGVRLDVRGLSREEFLGGEDHCLLATFPSDAQIPEGFRVIGSVAEGSGLSLDGVTVGGDGWDPYRGWNGGAG